MEAATNSWAMLFLASLTLANVGALWWPQAWLNDSISPDIPGCDTMGAVVWYCSGTNVSMCTLNP